MLGCGWSKSFMETHCSRLLWARFIPQKKQKNWKFLVSSVDWSCVWMFCMCVAQTWQNVQFSGQQARSNRRVQEVVRVKQRKKKLELNRSPTVWTTGVQSAAFGSVLICSAESPCELRCVNSLTSDRCLGARVSDPPLSPMIFFLRLAPRGFFLHWNGHGVFFLVVVCVNNKKSPRTGRFFSPVRPMRA